MSAANAFAKSAHADPNNTDGPGSNGQRPSKRQRAMEVPDAPVWHPHALTETSLEVDIMILDYLAFQATTACLGSRRSDDNLAEGTVRRSLQLVDSFLPIFKARHPQYTPDAELRLRLLLLRTSCLFTQRYTHNPSTPDPGDLFTLRDANRQRAEAWLAGGNERRLLEHLSVPVLPIDVLERNRAQVLHQLGIPAEDEDYEDAFYGTTASVSLLDLLPSFIEVSAVSSSIHGSSLTSRWMNLACEFMLQACLEQYLVRGATDAGALNEAFAWGYSEETGEVTAGVAPEINELFEDDEYAEEVSGWRQLKSKYVQELVGDSGHEGFDVTSHLEAVSGRHPKDAFEASILKFLDALSTSVAQPILVQLENGQLDGMSKQDTQEFLRDCGVDLALS